MLQRLIQPVSYRTLCKLEMSRASVLLQSGIARVAMQHVEGLTAVYMWGVAENHEKGGTERGRRGKSRGTETETVIERRNGLGIRTTSDAETTSMIVMVARGSAISRPSVMACSRLKLAAAVPQRIIPITKNLVKVFL